jgi:hypothetical protein
MNPFFKASMCRYMHVCTYACMCVCMCACMWEREKESILYKFLYTVWGMGFVFWVTEYTYIHLYIHV